jgi:signal recognition particle receptor subunit beta
MSAGNQTHGAVEAWLTWAFSPTISAIIATLLVATLLPIIIHFYLYNTAKSGSSIPTFLLIGPSGAGKTSLLTLVSHRAHPAQIEHEQRH